MKRHYWEVKKIRTSFWRTRWIVVCTRCNDTMGPFRYEREARYWMGNSRLLELDHRAKECK